MHWKDKMRKRAVLDWLSDAVAVAVALQHRHAINYLLDDNSGHIVVPVTYMLGL